MNTILQARVSSYFRDNSWDDGRLHVLKPLLQKSLEDGLPPNTGKLYVDPFTNEEHSQMELQPFYNRKVKMERLLEASTIVPFRCCLHKLVLSVLGGEHLLVQVKEEAYKDVPGTMNFHRHYRKELNNAAEHATPETPLPPMPGPQPTPLAPLRQQESRSSSSTGADGGRPIDMLKICNFFNVAQTLSRELVYNFMFPQLMPDYKGRDATGQMNKGGPRSQQAPTKFLHKRWDNMGKFVEKTLTQCPTTSWDELVVAAATHLLEGRTAWGWKQLAEDSDAPHAITLDNEIGLKAVDDFLQHVRENANNIKEDVVEKLELEFPRRVKRPRTSDMYNVFD